MTESLKVQPEQHLFNRHRVNKQKNQQRPRSNLIAAVCIISESEIVKVMPDYSKEFSEREDFKQFLFGLGIDTNKPVIRQDGIQHRNRFGEIVICSRWVGNERIDDEWINSGYASKEAIDKRCGSKILEDVYRAKALTEDMQRHLEARDARNERFEGIFAVVQQEYEDVENGRKAKRNEQSEGEREAKRYGDKEQRGNDNDE